MLPDPPSYSSTRCLTAPAIPQPAFPRELSLCTIPFFQEHSASKMDRPNKAKPSNVTGKKKHRKKTKAKQTESKEVKLEKAAREFQRNGSEYRPFLERMDKWLKAHHQQAMQLFCKYDKAGNGLLQYDQFKLGMRDLKIPCVDVQLHVLARLLDPHNSGTIDYVELGSGLDKARPVLSGLLRSICEGNELRGAFLFFPHSPQDIGRAADRIKVLDRQIYTKMAE
ncbi:uncharacterized protein LOC129693777 [Leucoraja erinacea]|uniref:uncharacterized protein LOC129693777 n=1 Tax=Leucoraja erinaceus TaxID=7782 RepID=UPI002457FE75|nr:uncharacterized protein LOC129693777 [Leucoraja erinacea]